MEVEPAEIGLKVIGRRSVEAAPALSDPGLLLALDLVVMEEEKIRILEGVV